MKKIPAASTLKAEIETPKVAQSITFLKAKQALLERFEDLEDFLFQIDLDNPPPELRGFDYHFRTVRTALAKALWSRECSSDYQSWKTCCFPDFAANSLSIP